MTQPLVISPLVSAVLSIPLRYASRLEALTFYLLTNTVYSAQCVRLEPAALRFLFPRPGETPNTHHVPKQTLL